MNTDRIATSIDVNRTGASRVVGVGGLKRFMANLTRCGVGTLVRVDNDLVSATNPARQDYGQPDVGRLKTAVTAEEARSINPEVRFHEVNRDICSLNAREQRRLMRKTDLIVASTDSFAAQARCNQMALEFRVPALFLGVYAEGRGGEIIIVNPADPNSACFRCAAQSRYRAFAERRAHVSSQGGTIMDLDFVDAIAAQVAVGMLTRGADNRFGRLMNRLGRRNLILIKIDPDFTVGDPVLFTHHLGAGPAQFGFTTIALERPRRPDCPDCKRYRRALEACVSFRGEGGVA